MYPLTYVQETVHHLQRHVVDLETMLTTAREDLRQVETDRNELLQVTCDFLTSIVVFLLSLRVLLTIKLPVLSYQPTL